jgi:hypothetical protein
MFSVLMLLAVLRIDGFGISSRLASTIESSRDFGLLSIAACPFSDW